MKKLILVLLVTGFLLTFHTQTILAVETTPVGAEAGPNATGDITAWVGKKGLTCPADYDSGDFLPDPYKDDKLLYRIDQSNIAEYEHRLSPGQIARVKRNKNFYFNIYPTHRNWVLPKEHLEATAKNLKTASIDKDNILQGFNGGVPFPTPQNGIEAIWNIKKPYNGDDAIKRQVARIVSSSGRIRKEINYTRALVLDESRLFSKVPNPEKVATKILSIYTYPADKAGTGMLMFNYIDDNRKDSQWLYIPTLRRVRRAPTMSGGSQMGGETTLDELGYFFRGPVNDWNWKLLGKKEMYIPANAYSMYKAGTPDKEECLPGDINPEPLRYELRRVWAIEGTVKEGVNHPYSKRVIYADEDNWYGVMSDSYDTRGNLWRFAEFHTYLDYCQDYRMIVALHYLNLESGRYEIMGGSISEDTKLDIPNTGLKDSDFTVQALRRVGR
jgi:hypothetical protein